MSLEILLDTHTLLWWVHQPASLTQRAGDLNGDGDNRIFVSPVSAIEIATKSRKGKLEFDSPLASEFTAQTALEGFTQLPISAEHAQLAGSFDSPHKDPWDRLLAAQARLERMILVTIDARMADFGIDTLW